MPLCTKKHLTMKIEKLVLQNINSLAGEYEIDFRHPALTQRGMFVITGPTGSGKTSILDAICFGLYGRSPRQKSMQQERDEIMTHGAEVCSATVWYEHEGVHYRSRVCHRRTKRKDSQKPFRALEGELHRRTPEGLWEQMNQKKADFKVLTQQITGLSYENFSRCMLLAQGDFAAFLKANENGTLRSLVERRYQDYICVDFEVRRNAVTFWPEIYLKLRRRR